MSYLFTDIETLPVIDEVMRKKFVSTLKPPGNIKLEESKQKWLDNPDNVDAAIRKTSLDGTWGSIYCIGAAVNGSDVEVICEPTEKATLEAYVTMLRSSPAGVLEHNHHIIVAHSAKFDTKFIHQRMLINGLGPLFGFDTKPYDRHVMCTGEMFSGDRDIPKLTEICAAFNIPSPKGDMDGSKVYEAFLNGEFERIQKYCALDVEQMRKVFAKMMRKQK